MRGRCVCTHCRCLRPTIECHSGPRSFARDKSRYVSAVSDAIDAGSVDDSGLNAASSRLQHTATTTRTATVTTATVPA